MWLGCGIILEETEHGDYYYVAWFEAVRVLLSAAKQGAVGAGLPRATNYAKNGDLHSTFNFPFYVQKHSGAV